MAELVLYLKGEGAEAAAEDVGAMDKGGDGDEDEEGEAGIHPDQDGGGEEDQNAAFDEAEDGAAGEEADALDVLHGAGEYLAGFGAVVEGEGEGGEFLEEFSAQVVGDVLGGDFAPLALVEDDDAFEEGEGEEDGDGRA